MTFVPAAMLLCWLCLALPPTGRPAGTAEGVPDRIAWVATFTTAQASARANSRPIFLAVNMDGEKANQHMVEVVYLDPIIRELATHTEPMFLSRFDHGSGAAPCERAGTVTCDEHRAAEKEVRRAYLKTDERGEVIAPQHVLLSPEGEVLLAVPYQISVAELEWCLVTAIQTVDEGFQWKLSEDARAPKRLIQGGVEGDGSAPVEEPPDKKEVDALIKEIRSVKKPWTKVAEFRRLIQSPERKAIEYAVDLIHLLPPANAQLRGRCLHDIGRYSPADYAKVVEPYLEDDEAVVRAEAVVALEQLGSERSVKALLKLWKREKEEMVRRELLHALPACGPADTTIMKLQASVATGDEEEALRIAALKGSAKWKDRRAITDLVRQAFQDEDPRLRMAAAWVVGEALGDSFESELMEAGAAESDVTTRAVIAEVWNILKEEAPRANLAKLGRQLEPDLIKRDR